MLSSPLFSLLLLVFIFFHCGLQVLFSSVVSFRLNFFFETFVFFSHCHGFFCDAGGFSVSFAFLFYHFVFYFAIFWCFPHFFHRSASFRVGFFCQSNGSFLMWHFCSIVLFDCFERIQKTLFSRMATISQWLLRLGTVSVQCIVIFRENSKTNNVF